MLSDKGRIEVFPYTFIALSALQSQGIDIVQIEAYEYADAPGIKHLFFYYAEDSKKAIPYFMLDNDIWEQIQLFIIQDVR